MICRIWSISKDFFENKCSSAPMKLIGQINVDIQNPNDICEQDIDNVADMAQYACPGVEFYRITYGKLAVEFKNGIKNN